MWVAMDLNLSQIVIKPKSLCYEYLFDAGNLAKAISNLTNHLLIYISLCKIDISTQRAYSEPYQTSEMDCFAKIVKRL